MNEDFFFTLQNVFLIYQYERLARQSIDDGQSHRYFYLIFLCQPSASNSSKQLGHVLKLKKSDIVLEFFCFVLFLKV